MEKQDIYCSYQTLGAHVAECSGAKGIAFSVWAPNAQKIRVLGDFNAWSGEAHEMKQTRKPGIWSLFIPALQDGDLYKYEIHTRQGDVFLKADPYAFYSEVRPGTASVIAALDTYTWHDGDWMRSRGKQSWLHKPVNIYEVHLGSWKRKADGAFYTYRELADELIEYVLEMGFTHIEVLPLTEHPLDGSWGYQTTGYFSATSRYGKPEDFMYFVDCCHQHGIGIIMDWVPGHFCKDNHGLRMFDGTPLYEYKDGKRADTGEWGTLAFDLGKPEVQSFLISSALFWFDVYHIDGLRVDAVASMLYLDFGKREGEWTPNRHGGRENLEAIDFLRKLNETIFRLYPDALMMAEESTAWPLVSAPVYLGGLGFNYKWNMGWMNDMLRYTEMDPIHRKWHHELLTFSFYYAFSENFVLPLSHDEVVHGKKSLISKMPGDYWRKFAGLRVLYAYMAAHPGKKLLFMGGEFGQFDEWNEAGQLTWNVLDYDMHQKLQDYVKELNHIYQEEAALWAKDHEPEGFEWIDPHDYSQSIVTFMRKGVAEGEFIVVVCNFTPVVYEQYRIGVPRPGTYCEWFNSDREEYGGSGQVNEPEIEAEDIPWHNQSLSMAIKVPPLACVFFKMKKYE
ncbi:1,4-alpha-glucan branching protein GlgB [Aneurinibacillus tyrosinisolvens]|uniref:1,4-alpha-glucan branching protein GlgB n=1 Tax=Aneurinibacillus tyrosinisolvens TaxID=1443435 RepID=UPI000AD516CF|nr:1,4-alpha-glucan branching protein GlgB [Aneurinibacillus tyrosinisolvens]